MRNGCKCCMGTFNTHTTLTTHGMVHSPHTQTRLEGSIYVGTNTFTNTHIPTSTYQIYHTTHSIITQLTHTHTLSLSLSLTHSLELRGLAEWEGGLPRLWGAGQTSFWAEGGQGTARSSEECLLLLQSDSCPDTRNHPAPSSESAAVSGALTSGEGAGVAEGARATLRHWGPLAGHRLGGQGPQYTRRFSLRLLHHRCLV